MKGMMENWTFEKYNEKHPVDERIQDKHKEEFNKFLREILPAVVFEEEGKKEDIATLKLSRKTWHKICCKIILEFPKRLSERNSDVSGSGED